MNKDYYKILGVAEFDSAENIKIAYRKLARKWHPDIAGNSNDTMLKFKEINEAYEVLSNKIKREEYDKARRFYNYAHSSSSSERAFSEKTTNPDENKKNFSFNWEDFWNKKDKDVSFNDKSIKNAKRGEDINSDIEISIFESINGVTKTINMLQNQVCHKCKGKRFINGTKCVECHGKGEITDYKKFSVKIPAGIKNGSKIRLSGEGCRGINGGSNGDLYLTIHIKEPKTYKTEGLNILKTVAINPCDAVLGSELKVSTLNGNVLVKIAPNTQNGQKIRLAGCGIVQNEKIGDMILTIEIKIPKSLSNEEINLYKKLKEISNSNIQEEL